MKKTNKSNAELLNEIEQLKTKNAALELKDSQNYFSAVFNNTHDLQILFKYQGYRNFTIAAVNNSYLKKVNQIGLKITENDLIGKSIKEVVLNILSADKKLLDTTINNYQNAIDKKEPVKFTESIDLLGKPYHSKITLIPIFNSEDENNYVLYSSQDITKEIESIQLLKNTEERFILAVKGSNDAIWDWENLDSDEYWWSDRLFEILGYKPSEVEARISNWTKWMHPEDSKKVLDTLTNHFEKKLPYQVEFRLQKKNGEYAWLFARGESERDENGKPIRMAGSVTDITERKKAEEVLKKTQKTFVSALESMIDAVFISDVNGNFIEFNEAFAKFHRIKDKKECNNALKEWPKIIEVYNLDGTVLPLDRWVVNRAINGEKSSNEEYILERKDTGEKWYGSYNFSPIRDQHGLIIGSVTVARDITEKKQAEQALLNAKVNAEESERQLKLIANNFVNGMIYQVAMLDEDRRQFNYISKNVEELYGCTMQEAKEDANLIYGRLHPDDINGLIEKEKEALRNMSTFETEARVITPNGNTRWAYYISKPRVINGIVCWDGIEVDITERKKMELELIKAKEEAEESALDLKLAQHIANIGNWQFDPEIGIPIWSDYIFKIYERNPEDGAPNIDDYKKIFEPDQFEIFNKSITAAIKEGKKYDIVLKLNLADNRFKWIRAICHPDKSRKSESGFFLRGTIQDITKNKQVEEELSKHREHLEELVKERTKELEEKNMELEEYNQLFVGREFRIKELKDRIKELEDKISI